MHNLGFALDGAWRVLVAGLALGAGLPILFALGIRSLAWADAGGAAPRPAGRALGYGLFAVVVLGVLLGITFIVATGFGKALSFDHIYPTIVPKH
ncbi:hypothetical protein GCM10010172_75660 [Paractinoplanes ferrugineus]|uniref:Uncharacterized protein n=1 Tax=Paractinoplanes ferrugineus TaxID=113564 RepID=A0A919J043_9ACTN|nr:hypothetical protein [Actinoplanes ferrugineus]GIE11279.1 hypothetical protein Afe05nite_31190 [Actinoplanes ferrugineus]